MVDIDRFNEVLERAMKLGREKHPEATPQHHAAFANSVAAIICAASGGYGGPSLREHWASRQLRTDDFDEAVKAAEPICYGPMTIEIARMIGEYNFDDPPGDVEEAWRLLREAGEADLYV